MTAAVIIPYGGDDPFRHRNLQHVLGFYREIFPDVPVRIADNEGVFHKAYAVNWAVRSLPAGITEIILNDADSLCYPTAVGRALELAKQERGPVFAFTPYCKLYSSETAAAWDWRPALYLSTIYEWDNRIQLTSGSHGCVAMSRDTFGLVGGYDERFEGWGYEDLAFNIAAEARWPSRRVAGPLVHLWHPPAKENPANSELYAQYERARGDLKALEALRQC